MNLIISKTKRNRNQANCREFSTGELMINQSI